MIDVSVIIPTYNRRNFTCEAVASIVSQPGVIVEVIVVDDGSSDGTPEEIESRFSDVRVLRRQHSGAPAARNAGLDEATGRYLKFLDSDDCLVPWSLASHVRAADEAKAAVSYGNFEFFGDLTLQEVGNKPQRRLGRPDDFVAALLNAWWLPPGGYLVNRHVLGHIRWDESFARNQDTEYALKLAFDAPEFHYYDKVVINKRAHCCGRIMDAGNFVYGLHCEKIADKVLSHLTNSKAEFTIRRRQAIADLYWHASRLVYEFDKESYERIVCKIKKLCIKYRPACRTYGGPKIAALVQILGIATAQRILRLCGR